MKAKQVKVNIKKARNQKEYQEIIDLLNDAKSKIEKFAESGGKYMIGFSPLFGINRQLTNFLMLQGKVRSTKVVKTQQAKPRKAKKIELPKIEEGGSLVSTTQTEYKKEKLEDQFNAFYSHWGRKKNKDAARQEFVTLDEETKQAAFDGVNDFKKLSIAIPEASVYLKYHLWTKDGQKARLLDQESKPSEIKDSLIWRAKPEYLDTLADEIALEAEKISQEKTIQNNSSDDDLINQLKVK